MAADLTELYPYVAPHVQSAPKPAVVQCARVVTHEFCDRSEIWREWIEDINIVADRASYNLSPSTPGWIKLIVQYKISGAVRALADIELENNEDLVFYPEHVPPDAITDGLDVEVVVVPRFDGASLPQWLFDRYWRVLMHGTIADLMSQKKRPWTDVDGAEEHREVFESGVRKAIISRHRKYKQRDIRPRRKNYLDSSHLRSVGRLGGV